MCDLIFRYRMKCWCLENATEFFYGLGKSINGNTGVAHMFRPKKCPVYKELVRVGLIRSTD